MREFTRTIHSMEKVFIMGAPGAKRSPKSDLLEFGSVWNLNPDEIQRFDLPSRPVRNIESHAGPKKNSILLIEDNPADAGLVRESLEEHTVQCELIIISNGERAIDFIHGIESGSESCPDLVILDLNLPRRPGKEVLARLRTSLQCNRVPILVLTSSDDPRDRTEADSLGASRYVRKPMDLKAFLNLGVIFKEMLDGSIA